MTSALYQSPVGQAGAPDKALCPGAHSDSHSLAHIFVTSEPSIAWRSDNSQTHSGVEICLRARELPDSDRPAGAPGRVVNLLASDNPESRVWGVAYEIPDEQWEGGVKDHLDHREKGGYKQQKTLFHPKESGESPIEVTLYLGPKDDKQYAGPAPLEEMALTILKSVSLIELTPFREMFRVVRQNSVNHKKFRLVPAARTKNISTTWPMHFATLIKMMIISTN